MPSSNARCARVLRWILLQVWSLRFSPRLASMAPRTVAKESRPFSKNGRRSSKGADRLARKDARPRVCMSKYASIVDGRVFESAEPVSATRDLILAFCKAVGEKNPRSLGRRADGAFDN